MQKRFEIAVEKSDGTIAKYALLAMYNDKVHFGKEWYEFMRDMLLRLGVRIWDELFGEDAENAEQNSHHPFVVTIWIMPHRYLGITDEFTNDEYTFWRLE